MARIIKVNSALRWAKLSIAVLFFGFTFLFIDDGLLAKPLYSYRDDQGTNVITDNYDRIPERFQTKVTTMEQYDESGSRSGWNTSGFGDLLKGGGNQIGKGTINVPGMSPYQSHALTVAGSLALLCFALRVFSRSQVLRFLSLWGLVMLALVAPVLIYFSQDGPLDVLRGGASQIQSKQSEHLKQAP
jgi:hypothetical protein